jgi:putative FmdB family regulatory protein
MPKYMYNCTKCNKDFEINCAMSQYKSVQNCPTCNTESERKADDLIPQNYIVNCSGFYGRSSK